MTDSTEDSELLARLQAADPAARPPVPSDDWIGNLTEVTMTSNDEARSDHGNRRTWLLAAAAAVVVGALGIGGIAALTGGDDKSTVASGQPTVTRLQGPADANARCMVPNSHVLGDNAQTAFDGTVLSIDGDEVTMEATHWYAGDPTDQVVVSAPSAALQALIGAVDLQEGKRYLVAGSSDGHLMVCGFSAPYTDDLAALYAAAFDK